MSARNLRDPDPDPEVVVEESSAPPMPEPVLNPPPLPAPFLDDPELQ